MEAFFSLCTSQKRVKAFYLNFALLEKEWKHFILTLHFTKKSESFLSSLFTSRTSKTHSRWSLECNNETINNFYKKKHNDFRDRYIESPLFQGTQQPPWWRSQNPFSCLRTWEMVTKGHGIFIMQPIWYTIFVLWWQSLPEWLEVWASFNVKGLKKISVEMSILKFWAK